MSVNARYALAGIGACIVLAGAYCAYSNRSIADTASSSQKNTRIVSPATALPRPLPHAETASTSVPSSAQIPRNKSVPESSSSLRAAASKATAAPTNAGAIPQKRDVERQLVTVSPDGTHQSLSGDMARSSLMADFKSTVQALQDHSFNDTTVSELSHSYRSAIMEQLSQVDPNARLSDFACGIQVCLGQIDMGGDVTVWQAWHKKFYADSRTPSYVFMEYDIPQPDGSMQRRFAITIDPKLNAIDVAPPS